MICSMKMCSTTTAILSRATWTQAGLVLEQRADIVLTPRLTADWAPTTQLWEPQLTWTNYTQWGQRVCKALELECWVAHNQPSSSQNAEKAWLKEKPSFTKLWEGPMFSSLELEGKIALIDCLPSLTSQSPISRWWKMLSNIYTRKTNYSLQNCSHKKL